MTPFRKADVPLTAFARLEVTYFDARRAPVARARAVFVRRRVISGEGTVLHEHTRRVLRRRPPPESR